MFINLLSLFCLWWNQIWVWWIYTRGSQTGVHVPVGVHLPIGRGTFKVSNWREKYVYILFISNYLCIYQWIYLYNGCLNNFFQGDNVALFITLFRLLAYRCNVNGCSQNTLPFLHHKENAPCYGNSRKKSASLAAVVRYIMIIFTIGYLQIFKIEYFSHRSIAITTKTKPQIMILFYLARLVSVT